ncbi:Hcp family type VI secretion system effector [Luteolibacter soli]|uniref:Type VI secretion system tube protein Hcp n=1 Tax=Luteolibacter soli TaxID=3135280 RepID=A0ABU9B2B7_9BACT
MSTLRPSRLSKTLALVPPAMALVAQHASGAFDAFIKLGDTIAGESTAQNHIDWIELKDVSWQVSRTITGTGASRTASTPAVSELTITKTLDRASTGIFLNAVGPVNGAIPTVTMELVDSHATGNNGIFYRLTLSNVMVSSQKNSSPQGADHPTETVTLNFTKIKVEYWYKDLDGVLHQGTTVQFDMAKGTAS